MAGNEGSDLGGSGSASNGNDGNSINEDGYIVIDPTAVGTGAGAGNSDGGNPDGEPIKRRRGRPPGSGRKAGTPGKAKTSQVDISGLEKILLSMHTMIAAAVKAPELAIKEDEAKILASAVSEVSKYYDIGISEKAQAWTNLTMVCGAIYGPKIFMMVNKPKQKHNTNNVVGFQGVGWNSPDAAS